MKNIILLATLLQFSFFAFAQINAPLSQNARTSATQVQRLDEMEFRSWNSTTNQWDPKSKYEYKYDDQFFLIKQTTYRMNKSNVWEVSNIFSYVYDDHGNTIEEWKEQAVPGDKNLTEKAYDEANNLVLEIFFTVNTSNEKSYQSKNEYSYDENGFMTTSMKASYYDDKWNYNAREDYSYDAQGNMIEKILYSYKNDDWNAYSKHVNTYDNYGNFLTYTSYSLEKGIWKENSKTKYDIEYTGNKVSQSTFKTWDKNINDWKTLNIYTSEYNLNSNLISYTHYNDKMLPMIRNNYLYNDSYKNTDLILPFPNQFEQVFLTAYENQPLEYIQLSWDNNLQDWMPLNKHIFRYSTQEVTAIRTDQRALSKIYPNPTTDFITFSFSDQRKASFELFDFQGRSVMNKQISDMERINLTTLGSGMYFYNIRTDKNIQSGKLVKR